MTDRREYVVEEICEDGVLRTRAARDSDSAYNGLRPGSVVHEFEMRHKERRHPDGWVERWVEPYKQAENEVL